MTRSILPKKRKRLIYMALLAILLLILSIPELTHKNKGRSQAFGTRSNGSLKNAYLFPYKGNNFRYFSWLSYYVMDDAYLHSSLHKTVLDAYAKCEQSLPNTFFRIMECANQKGGKMLLHKTHRNGLSIDFMVPKKKGNKPTKLLDRLGLWHYLLNFDKHGQSTLTKNIEIDFEALATHIWELQLAAEKNQMSIKMVILKLSLKDDLYKTKAGKKIKAKGIYFAQSLSTKVDNMHDDHYHIDFELK